MDVLLCKLLDALIMALSCNGSSWRFWSNFVFLVVCFVLLKNLHTAQISKSGYLQEICSSIFYQKALFEFYYFFLNVNREMYH